MSEARAIEQQATQPPDDGPQRALPRVGGIALALTAAIAMALLAWLPGREAAPTPEGRREIVFWHFWGGHDRDVVDAIIERFNASQNEHYARAVAMPGHNLDLKFFLSIAGEAPPDLLNQDDPVVADWAQRDVIVPVAELASPEETERLGTWLFPAARKIGTYRGQLYGVCNGLDVRAMYYDATALEARDLSPPETLEDLDAIVDKFPPEWVGSRPRRYAYLPEPRMLWAWGVVFGGQFYDPATGAVTADSEPIVRALRWMTQFSHRYGAERVAAFSQGDQALTGSAFPLLERRYVLATGGQWRVADLGAAERITQARGEQPRQYGVLPLPPPTGGRRNAGWINGNFFVVPRGCRNPEGAWALVKFWSGFDGHEAVAAEACAAGGWIPASQQVVDEPAFQEYLAAQPLFRTFVELAASEDQLPIPAVPGAAFFQSEIVRAAEFAMYRGEDPRQALESAAARIRERLKSLGVTTEAAP